MSDLAIVRCSIHGWRSINPADATIVRGLYLRVVFTCPEPTPGHPDGHQTASALTKRRAEELKAEGVREQ